MQTSSRSHHHPKSPSYLNVLFVCCRHEITLHSSINKCRSIELLPVDVKHESLRSLSFLFLADVIYFPTFYAKWNVDLAYADVTYMLAINQCHEINPQLLALPAKSLGPFVFPL